MDSLGSPHLWAKPKLVMSRLLQSAETPRPSRRYYAVDSTYRAPVLEGQPYSPHCDVESLDDLTPEPHGAPFIVHAVSDAHPTLQLP